MNKKKYLIGFGIVIFVIMAFIVLFSSVNASLNGSLIEVNYNEVSKMVDDEESFILVVSQSTCSHCATYRPKLKKIARNYGIDIYYIDYDKESSNIQKQFLDDFNLKGATPTTLFINDGKESGLLNRIEGDLAESRVIEKFKKMGFIEE